MSIHDITPIHPGEHLAEFIEEFRLSQYALAKAINVSPRRINEIVKGQRAITADTALRFGRFFGMNPQFWLNLQMRYEIERAEDALGDRLDKEIIPLNAA